MLSVHGATLRWTATARLRGYVESRTTPSGTTYVHLARTTDAPPPVPGVTVIYRVRPRYEPRAWSNQVTVSYSSGVQAAAKLGSTGATKPGREKGKREPTETTSEREAREQAEREAKEKAEQPPASGTAVNASPSGPPPPASGWHVAYADAFAAPFGTAAGQDNTWKLKEGNQGCCGNSDEINITRPSQVSITPEGLKLKCEYLATEVSGKHYNCGGISGGGASKPPLLSYKGETLAVEWKGKLPPNLGTADPGVWSYGTAESEFDFPEFIGWGSSYTGGWKTNLAYWSWFSSPHTELVKTAFNSTAPPNEPENSEHTYTTYIYATSSGKYRYSLYVDGVRQGLVLASNWGGPLVEESPEVTPEASVQSHLVITYALREALGHANGFTSGSNYFTVRSVAVYIDGAHAGSGAISNEGIVPGTTVK